MTICYLDERQPIMAGADEVQKYLKILERRARNNALGKIDDLIAALVNDAISPFAVETVLAGLLNGDLTGAGLRGLSRQLNIIKRLNPHLWNGWIDDVVMGRAPHFAHEYRQAVLTLDDFRILYARSDPGTTFNSWLTALITVTPGLVVKGAENIVYFDPLPLVAEDDAGELLVDDSVEPGRQSECVLEVVGISFHSDVNDEQFAGAHLLAALALGGRHLWLEMGRALPKYLDAIDFDCGLLVRCVSCDEVTDGYISAFMEAARPTLLIASQCPCGQPGRARREDAWDVTVSVIDTVN